MELEVLVKKHLAVFDVVDVGTHLIHAVGGGDADHVVDTRLAENAIDKVDGLVASVAQEDVLSKYALDLRQPVFQFPL